MDAEEKELEKIVTEASTSFASAGQAKLQSILILKMNLLRQTIIDQLAATTTLTTETNALTRTLNRLTGWLLGVTVAIGVLTIAQILVALGVIHR